MTTIKHAHEGYSCWTPKLCAALNAVAELRTGAIRHDDHELSVRLDLIEATLKGAEDQAEADERGELWRTRFAASQFEPPRCPHDTLDVESCAEGAHDQ